MNEIETFSRGSGEEAARTSDGRGERPRRSFTPPAREGGKSRFIVDPR